MLTLHYEWKLKSIKYLKQCATLYNFFYGYHGMVTLYVLGRVTGTSSTAE